MNRNLMMIQSRTNKNSWWIFLLVSIHGHDDVKFDTDFRQQEFQKIVYSTTNFITVERNMKTVNILRKI